MLNVTVKMHNLQELIRKSHLNGLVKDAVISFKDGRMKIEAMGFEDEQHVIDQTLTSEVNYPCETIENGDVAIPEIGVLLTSLEGQFERDDTVQLSVSAKNQLIISRTTQGTIPVTIAYNLTDIQFIKTYPIGIKTTFGVPIKLKMLNGSEKSVSFNATVVVDGQKLKDYAKKVSSVNAVKIPISVIDGKVITEVSGEVLDLSRQMDGVISATGNATSFYDKEMLIIFNHAIGTATLRLSDNSPIHIHFEHELMSADYLLQIWEKK